MKAIDDDSDVTVITDEQGRVYGISHLGAYWVSDEKTPPAAAIAYARRVAGVFRMPGDWLLNMHQSVSYLEPYDLPVQYHLSEEKTSFDSTTVGFRQTVLNTPVWNAGMTVTIKHGPHRVVGALHTGHDHPAARLPSLQVLERYRRLFAVAGAERARGTAALAGWPDLEYSVIGQAPDSPPDLEYIVAGHASETASVVRELLGVDEASPRSSSDDDGARIIRGRFYVYRFDPKVRLAARREPSPERGTDEADFTPPFPLAPVPPSVVPDQYYVVAEITFEYRTASIGEIAWRALVELETGAVLYLRPLAAGVSGLVFRVDPITATGDLTKTADQPNGVLNPLRARVVLPNIGPPVGSTQSLSGGRVRVEHHEGPPLKPPTPPVGSDFSYDVRTDDFAAVNAYYHAERFFETFESLGFSLATYFKNTVLPLPVDHAGATSHASADGLGGIHHLCFLSAASDITPPGQPIGRACDSRVMWHELGGHGALFEQVDSANFDFAHSAGDSLSAIFHDPESKVREPDRFRYAPFHPTNTRRFDRKVTDGWAWDGTQDDGDYGSEEILATTLFRVYLSIGGASPDLPRRQFASRMMLYLIFRAIESLTPSTNPKTPNAFAKKLMEADGLNWTSEGIFGGAYNKVIRWSFEEQGLYQPPGTPKPIATPGAPPPVDVYIDDGRSGEYPYTPVHWNTTTIWNRHASDGLPTHQPPKTGQTNFAYVKVKNRGTSAATNVRVRGFHSKPSAGLLWPNDFQPMTTAEIVVGSLAANNTEEKIVGPFQWTPVTNAAGHDSLLMMASAPQDPSNTSAFVPGEVIPDWRLVPNDNNIALRSVSLLPGINRATLVAALHHATFWAGNPHNRRAVMELRPVLPQWLSATGWNLGFQGIAEAGFSLDAGQQRQVTIDLRQGADFTQADVVTALDRDVRVDVYADGLLIGGVTYRLDPGV